MLRKPLSNEIDAVYIEVIKSFSLITNFSLKTFMIDDQSLL